MVLILCSKRFIVPCLCPACANIVKNFKIFLDLMFFFLNRLTFDRVIRAWMWCHTFELYIRTQRSPFISSPSSSLFGIESPSSKLFGLNSMSPDEGSAWKNILVTIDNSVLLSGVCSVKLFWLVLYWTFFIVCKQFKTSQS